MKLLLIEFLVLFAAIPLLYALGYIPFPLFGTLILFGILCSTYLLWKKDVSFKKMISWNKKCTKYLVVVAVRFLVFAPLILLVTYLVVPDYLFIILRERPMLWPIIMIFYPILSVIPQTIIYRGFLLERYKGLFSPMVLTIMAAFAFAYGHIIFHNLIAVVFTFVGGLFFLRTYTQTQSLLLSALEHALYGNFIFTVGLGMFFYTGFTG